MRKGFTKCGKMGGKNLTKCDETEVVMTLEEVIKAANYIKMTPHKMIKRDIEENGKNCFKFSFGGDEEHTFVLLKICEGQAVMIVPKELADDIRGEYE